MISFARFPRRSRMVLPCPRSQAEVPELREPTRVAVPDRHFPDGEEGEDPTGETHDRAGRAEEARPGWPKGSRDLHRGTENAHLKRRKKKEL